MKVSYAEKIKRYTTAKTRIWEIDFLRGFCIVLMIFDHLMYNFCTTFNHFLSVPVLRQIVQFAYFYYNSSMRYIGWVIAVGIFMFLSGLSTGLTKSNLFRGIKVLLVAYLLTFATAFLDAVTGSKTFTINFGILHTLAFCILAYALCVERGKTLKIFEYKWIKIYLSDILLIILIFASLYVFQSNSIALMFPFRGDIKYDSLFSTPFYEYLNFALGIDCNVLLSSDYIPILPWLIIFLLGAFASNRLYPDRRSLFPSCNAMLDTPIARIGNKTLLIYVLHQPIIFLVLSLIGLITTGKF